MAWERVRRRERERRIALTVQRTVENGDERRCMAECVGGREVEVGVGVGIRMEIGVWVGSDSW